MYDRGINMFLSLITRLVNIITWNAENKSALNITCAFCKINLKRYKPMFCGSSRDHDLFKPVFCESHFHIILKRFIGLQSNKQRGPRAVIITGGYFSHRNALGYIICLGCESWADSLYLFFS